MKKHKKIISGIIVVVLIFIAFIGVRNIMSRVETAEVNKTKTSAKTTDGKSCGSDEEMNGHYQPSVSFDLEAKKATITVKNGSFRITSVTNQNLLTSDPMTLGNLTPGSPMTIDFNAAANGDVILHFVLSETDDKCLAYDAATADSTGKKTGTYEFDMTLQLKPQQETPLKENTNYNGICAAFRTGQGYDQYEKVLNKAGVDREKFNKYNYAAVNSDRKAEYEGSLTYCFNTTVSFNYTEAQVASMINTTMNIGKANESTGGSEQVTESFKAAFDDAKQKALALNHDYSNKVTNGSLDDTRFGMTCDWKLEATGTKGDDYYVNKDYYYAKEEETTEFTYEYNYTSGNKVTETAGSCTRTCEESVVVEYGPPVAKKAGLCFEYKVKVTSRVICQTANKLQPPETKTICTPTPYCNQISGHTHQGGPTEEFEKCINSCDGGKYTQACSNKCYKEVYEEDMKDADPLAIKYGDETVAQKMWSASFPGYEGRYEWSNGKIVWKGSGYARWYKEFEDSRTQAEHGDYNVYSGFKKNDYGGGNHCQDNCYWSGCSANSYLNAEEAAKDTVENLNKYNSAIAECKASASCTTKTAYFDISTDYLHDVNGKEVKETVKFPIDTTNNKATLPSGEDKETSQPTGTEIFLPDTNEIGYAGCYDKTSEKNWYQAEWSFPGTWINNKTGDISYVDKSKTQGWHYKEDKFCIPLDAKSVNTVWWEWSEVNKNCYTKDIGETIDYNIHASTTDFGYFGWNFDFECFYAIRNEVCDLNEKGCCDCVPGEAECPDSSTSTDNDNDDGKKTTKLRDFAFRIVDTTELFPESENKTENNQTTIDNTGRQPGYNWSLDASVVPALQAKNANYYINPLELINTIQQRGTSIYNGDKYIDYKFVLDNEALAKIREHNKDQKKYGTYGGETKITNGVTVYYSDLLNELGSSVVKKRGTPGVNNEGEWASNE